MIKLQHLVKTNSQVSKIDSESEGELKIDEDYSPNKSVKNIETDNDPAQIIENNVRVNANHNPAKRKSTYAVEGLANKTNR